jgi:hypothetical protein
MNTRSTKIKEEIESVNADMDFDYGIKTNCIYAATINTRQIYTDKTGRFPVKEKITSWPYMNMMAMSYWQNQ